MNSEPEILHAIKKNGLFSLFLGALFISGPILFLVCVGEDLNEVHVTELS
jgi:hypothetical protein